MAKYEAYGCRMNRFYNQLDQSEWDDRSEEGTDDSMPAKSWQGVPVNRLPQDKLVQIARSRNRALREQQQSDRPRDENPTRQKVSSFFGKLTPFRAGKRSVSKPLSTQLQIQRSYQDIVYVPQLRSDEPILDFRSLMQAAYENWKLIFLLLVVCAVLGGSYMMLLPRKYTAQSSLYFDPRQLQLNWESQQQSSSTPAAVSALINSQVQILTSNAVLQRVVSDLSLADDGEFRVTGPSAAEPYATAYLLKRAISTTRNDNSYIVGLNVTTKDPAKSAKIANGVVTAFLEYETGSMADLYSNMTTTLDRRLSELSSKVHAAETAVDNYRAKNDMVTAKGDLISENRLAALNEALVNAQQKTIEASAKVEAASKLSLADAVAGANDSEVTSATLVALRGQYATMVSNLGRLESQLGNRHPSLAAAKASLQGLRDEIRTELKRISTLAQTELSQAKKAEQAIAKELATQKALKLSNASNQAELGNLELQAASVRNVYEAVLKRTRETNEEQNINQTNVRVIEKAEPPITADGPGRTILSLAGGIGGGMLGFGIGLAIAITRRLVKHPVVRSYFAFSGSR